MDISNKKLPLYGIIVFLICYLFFYLAKQNYEFVTYILVVFIAIGIVMWTDKLFDYTTIAIWGFSIWVLLHMLGGSVDIGKVRLYDLILIPLVGEPYNILRFDQFIHFFCYVVIAMLLYSIAKKHLKSESGMTSFIVMMAALGIGGLNEIIEFGTVVIFNTTGVGGYYNTALDLVFNLIGAIVGVMLAVRFSGGRGKKVSKKKAKKKR